MLVDWLIFAQNVAHLEGSSGGGFKWFYLFNPAVVWVLIPIAAILFGAIASVIKRTQKHRERMAMIAAGMHPDDPNASVADYDDDDLHETAAYR